MTTDPITGDLFHCCALVAFVEVARETGGWPDGKAVKAKAYRLYEEELARQSAD
jgi:hypothetical protein